MGQYRKEVREVIEYAETRGWECEGLGRSGHIKLRHPSGGMVAVSATPSSQGFTKAAKASIRRAEKGARRGRHGNSSS